MHRILQCLVSGANKVINFVELSLQFHAFCGVDISTLVQIFKTEFAARNIPRKNQSHHNMFVVSADAPVCYPTCLEVEDGNFGSCSGRKQEPSGVVRGHEVMQHDFDDVVLFLV